MPRTSTERKPLVDVSIRVDDVRNQHGRATAGVFRFGGKMTVVSASQRLEEGIPLKGASRHRQPSYAYSFTVEDEVGNRAQFHFNPVRAEVTQSGTGEDGKPYRDFVNPSMGRNLPYTPPTPDPDGGNNWRMFRGAFEKYTGYVRT